MEQSTSDNIQDNPLVSIVVPVYNAERYLHRCLDSIINQTYRNIEIVIVNDGSTDKSLEIINSYAENDKRIVIINKKNGGSASARNAGTSNAKGEYIWSIDSDDYAVLTGLEKMVDIAVESQHDIIISKCKIIPNENKPDIFYYSEPGFTHSISGNKALCLMLCTNIGGEPWTKLYKTALYRDNNIFVNETFWACDDYILNYQLFSKAKTVSPLNYTTINHINRIDSQSSRKSSKMLNFQVSHHLGYLHMVNYGFPTEDIKNAYYGCVGSDFLGCFNSHNPELLKKLNITKTKDYQKYLQYLSCYSLINDNDIKLSYKRKHLYAVFKNTFIRNFTSYILKLYSRTFKKK